MKRNVILTIFLVLLSMVSVISSTLASEDNGRTSGSISYDSITGQTQINGPIFLGPQLPAAICTLMGYQGKFFFSPGCLVEPPLPPCKVEVGTTIVGNATAAGDFVNVTASCGQETVTANATVPIGGGTNIDKDGPTVKAGNSLDLTVSWRALPTTKWIAYIKVIDP